MESILKGEKSSPMNRLGFNQGKRKETASYRFSKEKMQE